MKIHPLRSLVGCLLCSTALILSGCATPEEHSYNEDYNQNLTTAPKYHIEDHGADRFIIKVHQGLPSEGQERVIDVKTAASAVAATEAKRRGWAGWQLDYINENNQGWMHEVTGVVVPKNPVEYKGDMPAKNL